jgi:hypothetical protein
LGAVSNRLLSRKMLRTLENPGFPSRGMTVPVMLAFQMALSRGGATTGGTPVPLSTATT